MRLLPPSIERLTLDVTSDESVDFAVKSILDEAGRIDVLINNAGVNTAVGPAVETSLKRIQHTFETNLFGLIRVTQAVSKPMIAQAKQDKNRAGMIVNIGSVAGYIGMPYSAAYSATKSAVHAYTDSMRVELAPFGIKAIVVAPGKIKSSVGDTGVANMDLSTLHHYKHVEAAIEHRAQYSQRGKPAPMDTGKFAKAVVRHLERNGVLGIGQGHDRKISRGWLGWLLPGGGEYLTVGPMAHIVLAFRYLPTWVADLALTRMFNLRTIANFNQTKKQK